MVKTPEEAESENLQRRGGDMQVENAALLSRTQNDLTAAKKEVDELRGVVDEKQEEIEDLRTERDEAVRLHRLYYHRLNKIWKITIRGDEDDDIQEEKDMKERLAGVGSLQMEVMRYRNEIACMKKTIASQGRELKGVVERIREVFPVGISAAISDTLETIEEKLAKLSNPPAEAVKPPKGPA